eukprot:812608-Pelagomonas_calceolata.AAC.1
MVRPNWDDCLVPRTFPFKPLLPLSSSHWFFVTFRRPIVTQLSYSTRSQVDDLFAYFKFLRYKPYNDPAGFKELIKDKIMHNPENGYKVLSIVLQVKGQMVSWNCWQQAYF